MTDASDMDRTGCIDVQTPADLPDSATVTGDALSAGIERRAPDFQEARRFLTLLGEDSEDWTFQTLDDDKTRRDSSLTRIFHARQGRVATELAELNAHGAGVFVMVNRGDGQGRRAGNIVEVRAVFIDLDGTPVSVIESAPLEPHLVVESSPGRYHIYWRIEGLQLNQFASIQTALASRFRGDPAVKDLPRLMRLPGFYHVKDEPFRTRIVQEAPFQPYAADDFLKAFGINPEPVRKPMPTEAKEKFREGGRNAGLTRLAGAMRRHNMGVEAIAAALQVENVQRCDPPLDDEEVRRIAESIGRYSSQDMHNTQSPATTGRPRANTQAVTICANDITPEPIRWLWPGRIALGKVGIIAGDPGLGKSLLTAALASHVSRGTPWPVDKSPCPRGDVVLLNAEDDIADTIRPRLDAAGADPNHVHMLTMVREIDPQTGEAQQRLFSLRQDVAALDQLLTHLPDCRLVIVDPLTAYLDGTDSHKNAEVRGLIAPLAEVAAKRKVTVICVTHLNKGGQANALYRTTGSLAFVAAARSAFLVVKDQGNTVRRLLLPIKNNLGPDTSGLAYTISQAENGAAMLLWEPDPVLVSADEALAPPETDNERTERDEAIDWLRDVLADGPLLANDVRRQATKAGFSWATVRRAKDALGIQPSKTGFNGGWEWALPKALTITEDAQPAGLGTLGQVEHLGLKVEDMDETINIRQRIGTGPANTGRDTADNTD